MSKAISLAFAMMAMVAFTRQAECAELYRVSGTVVDAQSGAPLPRVRVALAPHEQLSGETTTVTGEDGRFSFDVPGGKFTLSAVYRGLREGFGQRTLGAGFGTASSPAPISTQANWCFVGADSERSRVKSATNGESPSKARSFSFSACSCSRANGK